MDEAERRHQELVDAQRALLDEQRNQSQQSERMHQEDMQIAGERQQALDRIAALEEIRLREERGQREREELRSQLRSGLPEFPEDLRSEWKTRSDEMVTRQEEEDALRALQAELEKVERKHAALQGKIEERLKKEFASLYQELKFQDALPESPLIDLGKLHPFAELVSLYSPLASSPFHVGITSSTTLSPRADYFLTQAGGVQQVASSLRHPLSIGAGPVLVAVVMALFLLGLVSSRQPSDVLVFLVLTPCLGLLLFALVSRHRERSAQRSPYLVSAAAFARKVEELVPSAIGSEATGGALLTENSMEALALAVAESLSQSRKRLYDALFNEYRTLYAGKQLEAREIEESRVLVSRIAQEIKTQKGQIEAGAETHKRSRRRYDYLRDEITRVGREIVEGLRVQGRKITAQPCLSCGERLTSESAVCPFCGSLQGEPLRSAG